MSEAILRKTFENFAGGSFSRKRFPSLDSLFCGSKVRSRKEHLYVQAAEKRSERIATDVSVGE